jgi:hypothetical protein
VYHDRCLRHHRRLREEAVAHRSAVATVAIRIVARGRGHRAVAAESRRGGRWLLHFGQGLLQEQSRRAAADQSLPGLGGDRLEIFHVGTGNAYTWSKTGQNVTVSRAHQSVSVDAGVAAIQQALGSSGKPGALTSSATNPTDLGTSGNLGALALTLKINLRLSEAFVTPATGFSGLSLVDMESVQLGGVPLTFAQANALDGQAMLQVADAADVAIGGGNVPYGLSISQLTSLLELLNGALRVVRHVVVRAEPSLPAVHREQRVRRPAPLHGVRFRVQAAVQPLPGCRRLVGTGCTDADYASFPAGAIALVERGGCTFQVKVVNANTHHASGVIIFNSIPSPAATAPRHRRPGARVVKRSSAWAARHRSRFPRRSCSGRLGYCSRTRPAPSP